jgi:hypothetical protein
MLQSFRAATIDSDFGLTADGKVNERSARPLPGVPSPLDDLLPNRATFKKCLATEAG